MPKGLWPSVTGLSPGAANSRSITISQSTLFGVLAAAGVAASGWVIRAAVRRCSSMRVLPSLSCQALRLSIEASSLPSSYWRTCWCTILAPVPSAQKFTSLTFSWEIQTE